jgi:hypothetical protein
MLWVVLSKTGRVIWLSLSVALIAWFFYLGTCDRGPLAWANTFQARHVLDGEYSPAMSALVVFLPAMLLAWLPAAGWDLLTRPGRWGRRSGDGRGAAEPGVAPDDHPPSR